jgi:hypothetical protein
VDEYPAKSNPTITIKQAVLEYQAHKPGKPAQQAQTNKTNKQTNKQTNKHGKQTKKQNKDLTNDHAA